MNRLSGAVLCGGASSRFGTDKALSPVAGEPMAMKAVRAMRVIGVDPIVAVAANEEQAGRLSAALSMPSIVDRWPGEGPLGGLLTALLWFRTGSVLVLPCDLPLVDGDRLEPLAVRFRSQGGAVVASDISGRPNCTIGIWPSAVGPKLKTHFDAGARRLDTVLKATDYTSVALQPESIDDADTVEELQQLLARQSAPDDVPSEAG